MVLTPAEMDRKIDEHFGFEARDDVEGVLATLAPDAEHDIVGWPSGPGLTHKGSSSYTQASAEETGACETSVLPVNAQVGRADFRPELGANGSHA